MTGQERVGHKTGPIQIVGVRTGGSWLKDETNTYVRWQERNAMATIRDQYIIVGLRTGAPWLKTGQTQMLD